MIKIGYDPNIESMKSIFIGIGPSFKKGYVHDNIGNIEIYNLISEIFVKPPENNGTFDKIKKILNKY